jgi:hypothetical protein
LTLVILLQEFLLFINRQSEKRRQNENGTKFTK